MRLWMDHYPATACAIAYVHRRLSEHPIHGQKEKEKTALVKAWRKNTRKEKIPSLWDSCRLLHTCVRMVRIVRIDSYTEMEEGGRGGRVSPLGIDLARGKEPWASSLSSRVSLLPRILASIILRSRPHPNPPAKIRRGIAYVRTSSSGIPFRTGVPRRRGLRKMSGWRWAVEDCRRG